MQDRDAIQANIVECFGCGYCNIGCKYGKKLSMLDTVLPWAQDRFPGQVRIVSGCRAKRIEVTNGRATGIRCEASNGRRALLVKADESVIVSAGAIASSRLLQRNGIGHPLVGKHLCFNMVSPLTAHFPKPPPHPQPYAGLQISHYAQPVPGDGFVLETWFNPPGMQSLFMPGWFEEHYANMSEYSQMASAGVVVGTHRNGDVGWGPLGEFGFKPEREDLARLVHGLKKAGSMYLKADADRVMPATFRYHNITDEAQLEQLDHYVNDPSGLSINSAHPQGGNAISADREKGVVDESFCVYDYENLHVCDASVFPSSLGVNPQLTVMALAHYAARKIAGDGPDTGPMSAQKHSEQWITGQLPGLVPTQPDDNGQGATRGAIPGAVP